MASVPFNNLITFSRGSNATVTGPTGLVQWAPNNLLTFSEQFDNAVWGKDRITVTANSAAAPDGTLTAEAVVPTAVAGTHGFGTAPSVTITSGVTYTASVYAKASGYNYFRLRVYNGSSNLDTYFDISTGAVATIAAGVTASIQDGGNGWYRCVCTFTAAATVAGSVFVVQPHVAPSDGTASFTGDGVSGLYTWGAQLELGSAATTYNSTTVKNLLGFSEAFDNASWGKTRASIVTGAQANPVNGMFNAQKLMEDTTASNTHIAQQTVTTPSSPQTISAYVKSAGRNFQINLSDNTTGNAICTFDLSAGAAGTVTVAGSWTAGSATVVSLGNSWYRISVTATRGAGTQTVVNFQLINGISTSYTGDGNSGVYIYGAQLSDSASLDPYVPTPAAAPSSTAYYGPRFDYDPVTLAPKGLLVEEARTNLFTYSEQFDNAAWLKADVTATANSISAPDGTLTADLINDGATTAIHRIFSPSFSVTSGLVYTFSFFVKNGTRDYFQLFLSTGFAAQAFATYNLTNGVASLVGADATATMTPFGNGWFRCTLTSAATSTTAAAVACFTMVTSATSIRAESYTGTNKTVYLWGAQLEAGAFATSYIPTVASTVTRSADVATINGSLFSQWYGQSAGTFVVDASTPSTSGTGAFTASSTSTDYLLVRRGAGAPSFRIQTTAGGVEGDFGTIVATGKTAATYRINDFAVSSNGGAVSVDTAGQVPLANKLDIGSVVGQFLLNGHIRSIDYIPARAADFQLQALTL